MHLCRCPFWPNLEMEEAAEYFEKALRNYEEESPKVCTTATELLGQWRIFLKLPKIKRMMEWGPGWWLIYQSRWPIFLKDMFINKVKKFRQKLRIVPGCDPVLWMRTWLAKRPAPPPHFRLLKVTMWLWEDQWKGWDSTELIILTHIVWKCQGH